MVLFLSSDSCKKRSVCALQERNLESSSACIYAMQTGKVINSTCRTPMYALGEATGRWRRVSYDFAKLKHGCSCIFAIIFWTSSSMQYALVFNSTAYPVLHKLIVWNLFCIVGRFENIFDLTFILSITYMSFNVSGVLERKLMMWQDDGKSQLKFVTVVGAS